MIMIYKRGRNCRIFNSRYIQENLSAIDSAAAESDEFWELPCCNFIWHHNHSVFDSYYWYNIQILCRNNIYLGTRSIPNDEKFSMKCTILVLFYVKHRRTFLILFKDTWKFLIIVQYPTQYTVFLDNSRIYCMYLYHYIFWQVPQ